MTIESFGFKIGIIGESPVFLPPAKRQMRIVTSKGVKKKSCLKPNGAKK